MVISLTYHLKQFKHVQETQQMTPPSVLASRECREARPNRAMSRRWQCPAKRVEDNVPTAQSVRLDLKKGFLDKIVAIQSPPTAVQATRNSQGTSRISSRTE